MTPCLHRRQLIVSSLGTALASLWGGQSDVAAAEPAPASAAAGGTAESKIYIGFAGAAKIAAVPETLAALRGHYQPELPLALTPLPGNSSARAFEAVHRGPADGSSVLLAPSGLVTLMPLLRTLPKVDPVADFVPVSPLGEFAHSLVVGPGVPAAVKTVGDFLAWVRDNPTQAIYGISALGMPPHFAGIAMARSTGLPFKPAGYQGALPMYQDLTAGSVPAAFMVVAGGRDAGHDPRIRQLAIAADQRWPSQPDVPTLHELGIADISTVESWGLYLPAKTPRSKVLELNEAVQQALHSPAVVAALHEAMLRDTPMTADEYGALLARQRDGWRAVVKRERFTING